MAMGSKERALAMEAARMVTARGDRLVAPSSPTRRCADRGRPGLGTGGDPWSLSAASVATVVRGSNHPTLLRSIVLVPMFIMVVGGCSSTSTDAANNGDAASPSTTMQGPPTGTLPPLVAPPRSAESVFSGEAAEVEKAFTDFVEAFDSGDASAAISLYSDPGPSLRRDLDGFMGNFRVLFYRINAIDVEGNTATIEYENAIVGRDLKSEVNTLLEQRDIWTKDDGSWKWVSGEASAPGIPQDLEAVTVTLADGAPISVPTPLPSTDFAFLLKNTGTATKGVFIVGIAADFEIASLIPTLTKVFDERSNEVAVRLPDGILELGSTPDVPANQDGTMVFNGRLPEGRYVLLTRTSSDGDRDPTLLPNEFAEFTIG